MTLRQMLLANHHTDLVSENVVFIICKILNYYMGIVTVVMLTNIRNSAYLGIMMLLKFGIRDDVGQHDSSTVCILFKYMQCGLSQ